MENNATCHVKGFLCKVLCSAIPVFVFLCAAGYLVNEIWLMPIYVETASVWRPVAEMQELRPWLFVFYAVLALGISALFWKIQKARMKAMAPGEACAIGGKRCPIRFGIGFGGFIGILLGTMSASDYLWLPIPGELAVKWFFAWLLQGIGSGIILALLCHLQKKDCAI